MILRDRMLEEGMDQVVEESKEVGLRIVGVEEEGGVGGSRIDRRCGACGAAAKCVRFQRGAQLGSEAAER